MRTYNRIPLAIRFQMKVGPLRPDGCKLWMDAPHPKTGYGRINEGGWHGEQLFAHRVAWEFANGPIPDDLQVLHKCDVRLCVNPDHLFLGTHADNMQDMAQKGRSAQGVRNGGGVKLNDEIVKKIREQFTNGRKLRSLGREYGVHHRTIGRVVKGTHWKHVTQLPT